ncbi:MAG: protein-L-isoaspartate(D-aspartate) O-methyltransferase [Nitrospirae bacterium]|nr:MAG: protein-L-isoaspartate(D-aspartate) O-methyltransferase [Nitrospirota bacterium]
MGVQLLFPGPGQGSESPPSPNPYERQAERDRMVQNQLLSRGIQHHAVLDAMRQIPRHWFVPDSEKDAAYEDRPLPIGFGQTISQPYIVAFMTEALQLQGTEKVLEIGTGSGYQTAILARLVRQVFTIEIVESLAKQAEATLKALGIDNVTIRIGDGYQGWPEEAPFDAILVTAAPDHIPQPLLDQLAAGGRLILPVGKFLQDLILVQKTDQGFEQKVLLPVAFVPLTGEAQKQRAQ